MALQPDCSPKPDGRPAALAYDQYGQPVPLDRLVGLPDHRFLWDEAITYLMELPWYVVQGVLLVPADELGQLAELSVDPKDLGLDLTRPGLVIQRIAEPFKRYNPIDGFYHA